MNELVERMLKQATIVTEGWSDENGTTRYYTVDQEKFAELIVRGCVESLWTDECNTSDLALEEYKKNSKKIREHFGVEE